MSVKLSVVTAVLTLGAAAIAHSVLSKQRTATPDTAGDSPEVAVAAQTEPPAPIVVDNVDDEAQTTLQPPPSSAFASLRDLKSGADQESAAADHFAANEATTDGELAEAEHAGGDDNTGPSAPPPDRALATEQSDPPSDEYSVAAREPATALDASAQDDAVSDAGGEIPQPPPAAYGGAFATPASPPPSSMPSETTEAGMSSHQPPQPTSFPIDNTGDDRFAASHRMATPSSPTAPSSVLPGNSSRGQFDEGPVGRSPHAPLPGSTSDTAAQSDTNSNARLAPSGLAAGPGMTSSPLDDVNPRPSAADAAQETLLTSNDERPGDRAAAPEQFTIDRRDSAGHGKTYDNSGAGQMSSRSPASELDPSRPISDSERFTQTAATSAYGQASGHFEQAPAGLPRAGTRLDGAESTSAASTMLTSHARHPAGSAAATPSGSDAAGDTLTSDLPGEGRLEGQQSPAIVLEKAAPDEIRVNQQTTFQIRVRNAGNAPAHNVLVVDRIPRGTELVACAPPCTQTESGTVMWELQTMKPGDEVVLSMDLLPTTAGEIGSVAQATFQAQASVRTICTKPELQLDVSMPERILIGQTATLEITVTNTGTGAATNVVIEEDVPAGFTHAAGRELEQAIGTLQPQQSRQIPLVLDSTEAGTFTNRIVVRGDGKLFQEDVQQIEVTTPQLEIALQGPTLRYLDRQATYTVRLANPGTASARNVELVTYLPKGMKYVTSDNHGQYDSQTHAVYWSLEELPAEKQGDVNVTVLPVEPGSQRLKADGRADLGIRQTAEHEVIVEGLAELTFTVGDIADPIEVGSETTYEIRVHNRGSKADTNIQLAAELPAGIMPISGEGPSQGSVQGQLVTFAPLPRLDPDEEVVFKIHARGQSMGDHVIRAQLQSAELAVAVTKEEITRVYTDK